MTDLVNNQTRFAAGEDSLFCGVCICLCPSWNKIILFCLINPSHRGVVSCIAGMLACTTSRLTNH